MQRGTSSLLRLSAISLVCVIHSGAAFHSVRSLNPKLFSRTAAQNTPFVHRAKSNEKGLLETSVSSALASAATTSLPNSQLLCNRAKDFLRHKNAAGQGDATLDPIFDMCSPTPALDLYGLRGMDEVRPGLTAFFEGHPGLHHELMAEPVAIGPSTVQYPFVKTWRRTVADNERQAGDNGGDEVQRWSSIDSEKPRNKVERLEFDGDGQLLRVSVVDADDGFGAIDSV